MVQRHDAKAQKDRERRCRHRLMEEGSENEDEEDSNELEEDDLKDEEGTHVGHPIILLGATLTKYHVQFSSHPVPTRLSEVPRQHPLTYSKSKVPKVVGGNIPDPSYEVSTIVKKYSHQDREISLARTVKTQDRPCTNLCRNDRPSNTRKTGVLNTQAPKVL